jgi:hypothetical protein
MKHFLNDTASDDLKLYSISTLTDYLLVQNYHPTFFQGMSRGYYNPRNRQTIRVPLELEHLTKEEILTLFIESNATDMPSEIEWHRFQLFIYSQLKS